MIKVIGVIGSGAMGTGIAQVIATAGLEVYIYDSNPVAINVAKDNFKESLEKLVAKNPYYNSGDLIGKQGVEESYEDVLRGVKGVKYIQKDKYNREIGAYKGGEFDTIAVQGEDVNLTIDLELQKYGEELMINKRGGIVAIEPKSIIQVI